MDFNDYNVSSGTVSTCLSTLKLRSCQSLNKRSSLALFVAIKARAASASCCSCGPSLAASASLKGSPRVTEHDLMLKWSNRFGRQTETGPGNQGDSHLGRHHRLLSALGKWLELEQETWPLGFGCIVSPPQVYHKTETDRIQTACKWSLVNTTSNSGCRSVTWNVCVSSLPRVQMNPGSKVPRAPPARAFTSINVKEQIAGYGSVMRH